MLISENTGISEEKNRVVETIGKITPIGEIKKCSHGTIEGITISVVYFGGQRNMCCTIRDESGT